MPEKAGDQECQIKRRWRFICFSTLSMKLFIFKNNIDPRGFARVIFLMSVTIKLNNNRGTANEENDDFGFDAGFLRCICI